ncbi:MAG: alpha-mannosidase, partial [Clostridia bacterium]|nr:alpha-mannosidase [Clostridia bacterium]
RSPTDPTPEADQGEIPFTYALCPHIGTLTESHVVKEAYELNNPLTAIPACGDKTVLPLTFSAVTVDRDNIIFETIKPTEEGNATVLRAYECNNARTKTTVKLGFDTKHVHLCDMMENAICEIPVKNNTFEYEFRGYEIATFIIES